MSSRGVFKIIWGGGAFITASFEELFFLKESTTVADSAKIVFEESIVHTDTFTTIFPLTHFATITETMFHDDEVVKENLLFLIEQIGFNETFTGFIPATHQGYIQEVVMGLGDEFEFISPAKNLVQNVVSVSDEFETVAKNTMQNVVSVSDTFEARIE
jgi:hypothetical protein